MYLFIFLLLLIPNIVLSQSDDSRKLYDDTSVASIEITMDTAALHWMYTHVDSDSEHYATFRFHNRWIDETIDSVGIRLRGNTSRYSQKKSFKIAFNSFIRGRKFHGVKKLNINGEHNDPSIIRSKLAFDLYNEMGIPSSRASHTRLYINGYYYGLYISIEDVGEEFLSKHFEDDTGNLWKCLYPADLTYLGEDPLLYANVFSSGRPAYELQTNEAAFDFTQLARLIRILNRTPAADRADSLERILEVPSVLKYFAMNVLIGSWDDYRSLMNNYYLYYNPALDKFTIIPYDYDNTFGIDWSGTNWTTADPYNFPKVVSGVRPLADAILGQNKFKDLFTHFLSFYNATLMPLSRWGANIDRLRDSITAAASQDPIRSADYGFTMTDFTNSYSDGSYQNQHVKFGLKQFVNLRRASLPAQLTYTNASPHVYSIELNPKYPSPQDTITVYAACFGKAGIKSVSLLLKNKDSLSPVVIPMSYTPVEGSLIVDEADRWSTRISPLGWGSIDTIMIQITDSLNRTLTYPRVHPVVISTSQWFASGIVINELLADNNNNNPDQNGEYDDWIELYNPTDSAILLTGKYLTDKPAIKTKWRFMQPDLRIYPGEHLLIWCDEQETQSGLHTNFKLSANGEFAALVDSDGVTLLDSISFGIQRQNVSIGRSPDGSLTWGEMIPSPGSLNNSITGVDSDEGTLPENISLFSYPNPFNPVTIIQYSVPGRSHVRLQVYDLLGRVRGTLVDEVQEAGEKRVRWDAGSFPSGVYMCRLELYQTNLLNSTTGDFQVRNSKLLLVR